jgi:hypothetical protein
MPDLDLAWGSGLAAGFAEGAGFFLDFISSP